MPVRARAQRLRRSLMMLGLIALAFIVLGTMLTYSRYRLRAPSRALYGPDLQGTERSRLPSAI